MQIQNIKVPLFLDLDLAFVDALPDAAARALEDLVSLAAKGAVTGRIRLWASNVYGTGPDKCFEVCSVVLENVGHTRVKEIVETINKAARNLVPISGHVEIDDIALQPSFGKVTCTRVAPLAVGDVVTLKSGGVKMTITEVYEKPSEHGLKPDHVYVSYTGPIRDMFGGLGFGGNTLQQGHYPVAALKKVE